MLILRKYQLDIIFLFFAIILIVWSVFFALKYFGADPHDYEWPIVGPLLLFYAVYLLKLRGKIKLADRRKLTGKSLAYWIIIGVTIVASYDAPVSTKEYWSINGLFIAFTLLLADSYWDFKQLTLRKLILNKNKNI